MKVLFLIVIHLVTGKGIEDIKPKSVNLNFETIFEFDSTKNSEELKLIEKVQNFLSNIKFSLKNARRTYDSSSSNESLKKYLEKAIKAILEFRDNEMEDFVEILKKEIDKYSILERNLAYRRMLAIDNYDEYAKSMPVPLVRRHLESALNSMDTLNGDEKIMLDSINLMLKDKSTDKLDEFINNLEGFSKKTKRDNLGLREILRQGLQDLYINYYFNLDTNAKEVVSNIIKKIFVIFRSKFENEDYVRQGIDNKTPMSYSDVQSKELTLPTPKYMNTDEKNKVTEDISLDFEATTTKRKANKHKRKHKSTTAKLYNHGLWLDKINVRLIDTTKRDKGMKNKLRNKKQKNHFHPQNKRFRIKSSRKEDDDDSDSDNYLKKNKKRKHATVKKEKHSRKSENAFGPNVHNYQSIESDIDSNGLALPVQPNRRMASNAPINDKVISITTYRPSHTTENYPINNKSNNGHNNIIGNATTKEILTKINKYNKQTITLPTTIKDKEQKIITNSTLATDKTKETMTTKEFKTTTTPITTLITTLQVTTRKTTTTTTEKTTSNITFADKVKINATLTTNIDVGKKNVVNVVDNKIKK